jgi:hypothetical protein
MKTILSRKELSSCTDKYVLVEREDQVYQRVGDEYVTKRYFTSKEVADILGMKYHQFFDAFGDMLKRKTRKGHKYRLTLEELRLLSSLNKTI